MNMHDSGLGSSGKSAARPRGAGAASSRLALLLIVVTTCALAVALVAVGEWEDRARQLEATRQHAGTLARLLEEQTAGMLWATDLALLGIAEGLRREPTPRAHDPVFEDSLRRLLRNLPVVRALFVIGADGFIVQDSDKDTPRRNLSDRPYFQAHATDPTRGLYIGPPLVSRSVGTWFLGVSRRVETAQGEFAGVVVAALEVRNFERFYGELGLGEGDTITLTTRDGILVARWPRADDARIGKPIVPPPEESALTTALAHASSGSFEVASAIDGVPRVFAFRALKDHPLVVLTGLSRERALAPWYRGLMGAAAATVAAIALACLLLWLAMRQARREALVQARIRETARLQAVGRLTAGVAHDFKNLLQAMSAALKLLAGMTRDDAKAARVVQEGLSSIERGRSLVHQLLDVARPQELGTRAVEPNALLAEIAPLLRNAAHPVARISLDLAVDLKPCRADASRLEAAVLNLVLNARDALSGDRRGEGAIRIATGNCAETAISYDGRTLAAGSYVRLTVHDDGPGMLPDVRRRAVEPFFTTKGEAGTGLGLAQVHGYMREIGGDMQIESEPGRGTSVHLYLPLASSARA